MATDDLDPIFDRLIAENPEILEIAVEVDPPFILAANVYELRTARGMTQAALAAAAGIAQPRIAEIERGDANPRLSTISRLARVLGVTAGDLLVPPPDHPAAKRAAAPSEQPANAPEEIPVSRRRAG